jgi:hypothetical protein
MEEFLTYPSLVELEFRFQCVHHALAVPTQALTYKQIQPSYNY